jgi:hypothetical protein
MKLAQLGWKMPPKQLALIRMGLNFSLFFPLLLLA